MPWSLTVRSPETRVISPLAELLLILILFCASASASNAQVWQAEHSGVTDSLMNVKAVNASVVWACGSGGSVLRTVDGGVQWQKCFIPLKGFDNVCIEPRSSSTAWVASIDAATGTDFRIFKTTDGGRMWHEVFRIEHTFGDAVRFFDSKHAIALGDPFPGDYFNVYTTSDGGSSWHRVGRKYLPPADSAESEFGVTACLDLHGKNAWFATASQKPGFHPRVYHSTDMGETWTSSAPIRGLSGIAVSLDFKDANHGVVVDNLGGRWAETMDGGVKWTVHDTGDSLWLRDIRFVPGSKSLIIAGGEVDSGYVLRLVHGSKTWKKLPLPAGTGRIRSVTFASPTGCWIVGGGGEILKWTGGSLAGEKQNGK